MIISTTAQFVGRLLKMPSKKRRTNQEYTSYIHNRARNLATKALIDLHKGQYEVLKACYLKKLKEELEWEDLRTIKADQRKEHSNKRIKDE